MRHATMMAAVLALVLGSAGTAFAHAYLKAATPPVGGTVPSAPGEVAIDYSESVEPRFSTITVQDARGARVDRGDAHTAPGNDRRLVVGLKPLPAGTYKVIWHATSTDTHRTEGSYGFTVGR